MKKWWWRFALLRVTIRRVQHLTSGSHNIAQPTDLFYSLYAGSLLMETGKSHLLWVVLRMIIKAFWGDSTLWLMNFHPPSTFEVWLDETLGRWFSLLHKHILCKETFNSVAPSSVLAIIKWATLFVIGVSSRSSLDELSYCGSCQIFWRQSGIGATLLLLKFTQ